MDEQIITTANGLAACCQDLATQTHFGFDTEFVGEDSYHPRLCLVQVATEERCCFWTRLRVAHWTHFGNWSSIPRYGHRSCRP